LAAGGDAPADVLDLLLRRFFRRGVDAARVLGHGDENLAQRHGRRRRELVHVRLVVLARLVLGDADLAHDLVLLDALDDHRPLEIPPEIGHRHVLGLQRGLQLLVGLDFVFLLDALDDALELIVAEPVAELLPALRQQRLVDHVHHDLRRDLVERLLELGVAGVGLRIEVLALLPQRGDLPLLEVALGEDVAVDLDQDLLEDFGARRGRDEQYRERRRKQFLHKSFEPNILAYPRPPHPIRSLSSPPTRSNTPPGARGSSFGDRRISSFEKPGVTSPVLARAVHHEGAWASRTRRLPGPAGRGAAGFPAPAEPVPVPVFAPPAPSSASRRPAGGTSVRSDRCRTSATSLAGSTFAWGLNFMTTVRASRSIVSMPRRSAMTRMRP